MGRISSPAFPYYAFTKLSDADIAGLYAYLMSLPAVRAKKASRHAFLFPLSVRAFQEGWKILFFRSARYRRDPSKNNEWNRGAYLAYGLAGAIAQVVTHRAISLAPKKHATLTPLPKLTGGSRQR